MDLALIILIISVTIMYITSRICDALEEICKKDKEESKWFYDKRNKKHIKERLKEIRKLSKYNRRRSTRNIHGSSYVFSRINKWMRRYKWIEKTLKITNTVKNG